MGCFNDNELLCWIGDTHERGKITVKNDGVLSADDLISDFAVTSKNELRIPIAKIRYIDFDYGEMKRVERFEPIYDLETLRRMRVRINKYETERLLEQNRQKYITEPQNVTDNFVYIGHKNLDLIEQNQKIAARQQKFLEDNNYIEVIVSHADCGYPYRGHASEAAARDYADFICDGTNDTEILQQAIDSHPGENIAVLLLEDEYKLTPTSGEGTAENPYVCLNINRDNLIIRTCDRRTSVTFAESVTDRNNAFLFNTNGHKFDLSTVNLCLDELNYMFEEYTYPEPTAELIKIKNQIKSACPLFKQYSKYEAMQMLMSADKEE